MIEIVNILVGVLTVALGGFGFLAPRYTLASLDLEPTSSTMGLSEVRASVGGLFVALGLTCVVSGAPALYFATGIAIGGAGAGRVLSLALDAPPRAKAAGFAAVELAMAVWLIAANWSATWSG